MPAVFGADLTENLTTGAAPTWSQLHERGIARLRETAARGSHEEIGRHRDEAACQQETLLKAATPQNPHLQPETASRHMLAEVSGYEMSELLSIWHEPAPPNAATRYEQMLQRLLAGEPLQYVLGSWGFRCLDLFLDNRVLIPRPETEIVVEVALKELANRSKLLSSRSSQEQAVLASQGNLPSSLQAPDLVKTSTASPISAAGNTPLRLLAADLGCGSGAIGLSLAAECPNAEVICTDISADALAVTRANLAGIGTAGMRVRLAQGSWYGALEKIPKGTLDLIVSNPPYIADHEQLPEIVADHEPANALFAGPKGTEAIFTLLNGAPQWLAPGGSIVCEIAPHQATPATQAAQANGLTNIKILPDLADRPRVLRAQSPPPATPA